MALILLHVLVLGVTAAAVDDIPITWSAGAREWLPCEVPDSSRVQLRRPPPLIDPGSRSNQERLQTYTWMRGDERLSAKVSSNGTLKVSRRSGEVSGDGVYQCMVRHQGGHVLGYPVHLKFAYMAKKFSVLPANVTAYVSQPLALSCDIDSGPPAAISWLRNEETLPEDTRYHMLANQLLIIDVRKEDAGLFRCIATNTHLNRSRVSYGGRVDVETSPGELEPGFLEVHHDTQLAVARGSRVVLPCPVTGLPRPKLIWELKPPAGRISELESVEEVLVLHSLEDDQEGLYSCAVEGHSDLVKTFNVTLTEPVSIIVPPVSKETLQVSTIRFNCTASGTPEPNITWYKDGKKLELGGRHNLRTSVDRKRIELVISEASSEDAGVYQCFARNSVSVRSAWAELWVRGESAAAPTALRCAPAGPRAVALRWSPVPSPRVIYTISVMSQDKSVKTGQPYLNTEQEIVVKDALTPYIFQVRAFLPKEKVPAKEKERGHLPSEISEGVLCQGQGVPVKLSTVEDKIIVGWGEFAAENPGVVEWVLQYRPENTTAEHNITLSGDVHNYTIRSSEPLEVRVLGTRGPWLAQNLTLLGWTSSRAAAEQQIGGVIAVPVGLEAKDVGDEGFTLSWRCDDGESYTYVVCVERVDAKGPTCQESDTPSATVVGLQPGAIYEARVQARFTGRAVFGAFSEPLEVRTLPPGSQRFKELKYEFENASAVRVWWRGPPARFTVHHSAELTLPVEQWASVTTGGNSVLITNINPKDQTFVMVTGYEPDGHSQILTIPAQNRVLEAKDLRYEYQDGGVSVWWESSGTGGVHSICYSQNITHPLDTWPAVNVTGNAPIYISTSGEASLYVAVAGSRGALLTIPPAPRRPAPSRTYYYLCIGVGCGVCLFCLLTAAAVWAWRRRKTRSPLRTRRRHVSTEGPEDEAAEMKSVGSRLANGGGAKDAGEPLLNGHVHITENPNPASKTPNGRMKKGRRIEAFDVSRNECDTTQETVLDDTAYSLLDTSRPLHDPYQLPTPPAPLSRPRDSFAKLPDDNMNEFTRTADFQLDNSKIQPTLQPNG